MDTTRSTKETELTELEGGRELELPELFLSTATNFTDKKKIKFSSYIRKFRIEQLQSDI
jgi:hypothetical protein